VTTVILDGKPLGQTPKVGVSVSPGTHTVIFVHPEQGRKAKSVTVEAGKTATAVVRF
jgi:serine/threonine-protein kinase